MGTWPKLLVLAVALGAGAAAPAQEPTPLPLTDKVSVVLDGEVLFQVGESGTWSPEQRAKEINRILHVAAMGSDEVHLELAEHDGYPTIRMGEWHLVTVTESDALPGMDPGEQAQRWLQRLEAALQRGRDERSAGYRTAAAARMLGVLMLAALLHWLLWRASRRLPLALGRALKVRMRSPFGGKPAWQTAVELGCVALQAGVWLAAGLYILERFPDTRQLRYQIGRVLGDSLRAALFTVNERSVSALDLLWLVATAAALWVTVSLLTGLVSRRLARATGASRGALQPAATLTKYVLIFIGMIVILQIAGLNLSSLAILASVLGVGIGFGLQNIANNFVSGIVMSFERSIKPGDFVSIGDLRGTVERIGGRSTIIRTLDRVSIIVPNSQLLEREVINWTFGDPVSRLHVPVGVSYGSTIEHVRAALLDAAHAHPGVLQELRPEVRFIGFGESALDFALLVWIKDPAAQDQIKSDLCYQIEVNLGRAGVVVPFPQLVLHLPPAELDAVAARLRGEALPERAPAAGPTAAPAPPPPSFPTPSWRATNLEALVARMRGPGGLEIADRRHLLKTHPKCFVGSQAVDWLVRAQDCTRDEAVDLGQNLVERGLMHHVLDEHPFRDGHFYYRFYADEGGAP